MYSLSFFFFKNVLILFAWYFYTHVSWYTVRIYIMPNFMHKLRITFYQNAAELLSAIYYESNASHYYLPCFRWRRIFMKIGMNFDFEFTLVSKARVIVKPAFMNSWKTKWYFLATNILSHGAIIKSLIRSNNDAEEIFKQTRKGRVAMLYEDISIISYVVP